MAFDQELDKYGLSQESYEKVLNDIYDKLLGIKDIDWSEIKEQYNIQCNPDTIRKASQTPFGGFAIMQHYKHKMALNNSASGNTDDSYIKELELKRQELEKEKVKFRDQRNDLNRQLRNQARFEERIDALEISLKNIGRDQFPHCSSTLTESDNDLLITLSDLHLGAEHYSFAGCFNTEIAKERLEQYLRSIIEIQGLHKSENCYVSLLGDLISGSIHQTLQVSNRENVIEQITVAAQLVSEFLFQLRKHFKNVYVNSVNGNHSRIAKKEDAVKDERLDSLIPWYCSAKLSHFDNVHFELDQLDSTLSVFDIRGKTYVSVHGDYDAFSDSAVAKLVLWLGFRPDCILFGHKHFPAMSECSGIKMIQTGSLSSTGDDFTIQKRLRGKASQSVMICTPKGIKALYPVELD